MSRKLMYFLSLIHFSVYAECPPAESPVEKWANPIKQHLCYENTCEDFEINEERIYCDFEGSRREQYPRMVKKISDYEYKVTIPLSVEIKRKLNLTGEEVISIFNTCIRQNPLMFVSPGIKIRPEIIDFEESVRGKPHTSSRVKISNIKRSHSLNISKTDLGDC